MRGGKSLLAVAEVGTQIPEAVEQRRKIRAATRVGREAPRERGPQVVVVAVEPIEPTGVGIIGKCGGSFREPIAQFRC
jgi:hypothetical protein